MTASSFKPLIGGVVVAAMLAACGGGSDGSSFFRSSASSSNNSSEPSGSTSSTTPDAAGGLTLAQQIEQLERKGGYPTLDRSSDIAGPDANKNGVRDDIEAWINTLNVTEPQRKALMQDARATQHALVVDLTDKAAVQQAGEKIMSAVNCGGDRFTPHAEYSKLGGKIEAMTANTRQRAEQYMKYNKASSGSVTTLPNHDTCEP